MKTKTNKTKNLRRLALAAALLLILALLLYRHDRKSGRFAQE